MKYGTVRVERGSFVVEAVPHVALRVKRAFGGLGRGAVGPLSILASDSNARDLEWFLTRWPMDLDADARRRMRDGSKAHVRMEAAVEEVKAAGYVPREHKLALPLRRYQRKAVDLALRTGRLLLADDVGLGKTPTGIGVLADPSCRPGLVVTMTHLPDQWEREIAKFLPGAEVVRPKKGVPADRDRVWLEHTHPDVVLLSYSKLAGWADSLAPFIKSVVFDEVQELRTGSASDKGRAAELVARAAKVRVGMSATPIYNYGGEAWNILDVLEEGCLGTWPEFVTEWCHGSSIRQSKTSVSEPEAFGAMLAERGLLLCRTGGDDEVKAEVPELERPARIAHEVRSDRKIVEEAQSAAAEYARILLAVGGDPLEKGRAAREIDWRMRQATGIAKAPHVCAFTRMLVESGEKVVLYGWHHAVYRLYLDHLVGLEPVTYTGKDSQATKRQSLHRFINGSAQVLVMSLRAGAGLEGLQDVSSNAVFGELDWSPGAHTQCLGRLWRPGQKRRVVGWFLHTKDGSDPVVLDVLGIKAEQAGGVLHPDAPLFKDAHDDGGDRIRRLARACLERAGAPA